MFCSIRGTGWRSRLPGDDTEQVIGDQPGRSIMHDDRPAIWFMPAEQSRPCRETLLFVSDAEADPKIQWYTRGFAA